MFGLRRKQKLLVKLFTPRELGGVVGLGTKLLIGESPFVVWPPELSAQKGNLLLKVCQDTGSGDNKYSHPFTFRYWWISSVVFVLRGRLVRGGRRSRLNHPAFWKRGLLRIA
jgi:hypothetical protein